MNRSVRLAGAAFALAVTTSCAPQTATAVTRSGISGTVVAGPTCPVETPESPCPDRPVPDARVVAKGDGTTKATRTDTSGRFRLRLRPGTYNVTAASDAVFGCDEQRIRVVRRRYSDVTIVCDTGIR